MTKDLILEEVYDIWPTSFLSTWLGIATVIAIIALAGLAIYVAYIVFKWYTQLTTPSKILAKLNGLKSGSTVESRNLYKGITDSMKHYFIWRYNMPKGLTDFEISSWLVTVSCPEDQRAPLQKILSEAQTAKFGEILVPRKQIEEDVTVLIKFIENTKDVPL